MFSWFGGTKGEGESPLPTAPPPASSESSRLQSPSEGDVFDETEDLQYRGTTPFSGGPRESGGYHMAYKDRPRLQSQSPYTHDVIWQRTKNRIPYFEIREVLDLECKEKEAATKIFAKEVRDICRAEIDEYIDCMIDRHWTVLACKPLAIDMRNCVRKYETPEYMPRRIDEIMREREKQGEDIIKRQDRMKYNRYFNDSNGDGWLPPRPGKPETERMPWKNRNQEPTVRLTHSLTLDSVSAL